MAVSILLAVGIQAWWEGRQIRAEEAGIIEGRRSDFEANQTGLVLAIELHRGWVTSSTEFGQMGSTPTMRTLQKRPKLGQ
jgi:hypothetical protein